MSDKPKLATDMTAAEYAAARSAAVRARPGMSAAEAADLEERRGGSEPPKVVKNATDMSDAEYAAAKSKAIRGNYP